MSCVPSLVSCEWLKEALDGGLKGIRVLDASWHPKENVKEAYSSQHIAGATHFDIDEVADLSSSFKHMLPSAEQFGEQVGQMGISNDTHVVVYDNNSTFGLYAVARTWWMFQVFGHSKVSILDGGLPKWIAGGNPTVSGGPPQLTQCLFQAKFNPSLVKSFKQMMDNYASKEAQVIDARPKGLYDKGHIIGATNIPFTQVIDQETKCMKDKVGIQKAFESASIDLSRPVIAHCKGGVVSPLLSFGAHLLGKQVAVYDGSFDDWYKNAPRDTMEES